MICKNPVNPITTLNLFSSHIQSRDNIYILYIYIYIYIYRRKLCSGFQCLCFRHYILRATDSRVREKRGPFRLACLLTCCVTLRCRPESTSALRNEPVNENMFASRNATTRTPSAIRTSRGETVFQRRGRNIENLLKDLGSSCSTIFLLIALQ
jgi:hypothetical protein